MPERHSVQIPIVLWKELCEDAAEEMKKRRETVTPSSRLREILHKYFDKKNCKKRT